MPQSLIYTSYNGSATLQPDNIIPLGSTIRRYGKNLSQSGDGVLIEGCGYYKIDGLVNVTPTAEGNISISLTQDGQEIQGGVISIAVSAPSASTESTTKAVPVSPSTYALPVQAVVRMKCCSEPTTLQMVLGGVSATVDRSNLIVTKL